MSLTSTVIHLLGKIIPPKPNVDIPEGVILRYEPRFKRFYVIHTLVGLTILFGMPLLLWYVSGFLEKWWYVQRADAIFSFTTESGVLGVAVGMMLGFGVSLPLAYLILEGYAGKDFMAIYKVWYDRRPNHPINSDALGRGMMCLFIPLALFVALYMRYDYTFVIKDNLIEGHLWSLSEKTKPLNQINSIEMQVGKIAPNGDYKPGFRYRLRFNNHTPWESPFFSGSFEAAHARYRPMIDYMLERTKLEMKEIKTGR